MPINDYFNTGKKKVTPAVSSKSSGSGINSYFNVAKPVVSEKPIVAEKPVATTSAPVLASQKTDITTTTPQVSSETGMFDKAVSVVKKIADSVGSWYSDVSRNAEIANFKSSELMYGKGTYTKDPVTGKTVYKTPKLEAFKLATSTEEQNKILAQATQDVPVMKFLNSPTGKKVTGTVQEYTSNIPLKAWASIKAIGDDTYDEAYSALLEKSKDPNNSRFTRIMYGLQDSGVQSAIGALLSVGVSYISKNPQAGQAVSLAYFAPISAESQRQDNPEGNVTSIGNVAIDTIGDTIISGVAESALKNVIKEGGEATLKTFAKEVGKGFLVEGTTEPAQTFLKYANDYKNAKTDAERQTIVANVTQYVKSGGMVDEFLIGGLSGALITGASTGLGTLGGKGEVNPSLQSDGNGGDDGGGSGIGTTEPPESTKNKFSNIELPNGKISAKQVTQGLKNAGYSSSQISEILSSTRESVVNGEIDTGFFNSGEIIQNAKYLETQNKLDTSNTKPKTPVVGEISKDFTDLRNEFTTLKDEVTSDTTNTELVDRLVQVQEQLKEYQDTVKERAVYISDDTQESPATSIQVVEYQDGKVAIQIEASSKNYSISRDFNSGKLYNSKEEAITDAKKQILNWADTTLQNKTADAEDITTLTNIKEHITGNVDQLYKDAIKGLETKIIKSKNDVNSPDYVATQAGKVEKGYQRFTITLDDGTKVYADFDNGKGIGQIGGMSHVQFQSITEGANPISNTGYKSHFSNYNPEGKTEEQIKQDITDLGNMLAKENKPKGKKSTQKEIVKESVSEKPKTIKEVATETGILEPNVRRILGVGAKDGTFTRKAEGVYVLSNKGQDIAWVEVGNALEAIPRLAKEGFKADTIFLDIPYDLSGNKGGNRMNEKKGTMYETISPDQLGSVAPDLATILRTEDSYLVHMISQSDSSKKKAEIYTQKLLDAGLKPVAKGDYYKMTKGGKRFTAPMRSTPLPPEGIIIFNKSGNFDVGAFGDLQFKLVRPTGYKTEKPAELLKQLIEMTTNEGDTLFDPFAGSGVAGAEATKLGVKSYSIEKNPKIAENITKPRIEKAVSGMQEISMSGILNDLAKKGSASFKDNQVLKPVGVEKVSTETLDEFIKQGEGIKVGDTFNTNGVTNMESPVTVTSIEGRTVKFKDVNGTEYQGLENKQVRTFLNEGIWTRHVLPSTKINNNIPPIDNTGGSNIINANGTTNEKGIPNISNVSSENDRGGSQETPSEVSGYDRATMLVESGNGSSATETNGYSKRERQLINEQVETVLETKDFSTNPEDYTPTDRELMAEYSGAGGKESVGGEGAGLLNEYYTPQPVIDKMWEIAKRLNPTMETAFEPSAGTGRIISSSPAEVKMDGAEIQKVSGTIASILNPDSKISIGDFQELFFDKKTNKQKPIQQYDLLIGNPPFGERAGFLKGKGEESKINREEEYFIKRGLDMTKEGGYLVYVVNSSFLKTGTSAGKEEISKLGQLVEAYRLPENSFEDTTIGTDIVVFKKLRPEQADLAGARSITLTGDNYFKTNTMHQLGATLVRKNRFGKEETYVKGDLTTSLKYLDTIMPTQQDSVSLETAPEIINTKEFTDTLPAKQDLSKMTFYHGTLNNFDNFSMKKAGENTGWENAKFGIFFSDSKQRAEDFVNDNKTPGEDRKAIVKEVTLDLKNPIDLTLQGILNNESQASTIVKLLQGEDMGNKEALQLLDETIDLGTIGDLYDGLYSDIGNKKILQMAGYDGIISQFGTDDKGNIIKEYVVFDTNQIKQKVLKPVAKAETPSKPSEPRTKKDSQAILPKKNAKNLITPTQDISNNKKVNPAEVDMLKRINRDMSIPEPTEKEIKFLNYDNGDYIPDAMYFSGDIYTKLDYLKNNKKKLIDTIGTVQYNKQLSGLEKILPTPVTIKDIAFDPIDRHVNNIKMGSESGAEISVLSGFTTYIRTNDVSLSPRVHKYDVIGYVRGDQAGKDTKPIMGLIKSDAKRLFNHYIKNELDPAIQKTILDKYNREKNGYVRPDYSRVPVEVKDMAKQFRGRDFRMSQTQKEGVGFLVNKGSGAIAYGVGVGKTHTLAIATKANMDKGWTKRPLFTVPKSTIDKTWIATLHEMFPTLAINNLEGLQAPIVRRLKKERGENPKNWIKDGEMTIISHEGLLRLGFKENELRKSAADLEDALWTDPSTKRGAEKAKTKYDEILGNAQKYVTDVMLSDLGFDHISVDEVHNFRKIFQGAKPETKDENGNAIGKKRFGNVIGGTPSKRAQQLFLITQYIQKTYDNRNVFLASATPFENHATEVYNILSLVARDRMKAMGIININDFFSTFANFEVEIDRKLNGEWLNTEKMKSFANLPALQSLIKEFIDFQEDPTLVRPERRVITPQLQMSDKQIQNLENIQNLLRGIKVDPADPTLISTEKAEDGAFLKASTYSIANGVSPYFIKEYTSGTPTAEQIVNESPKIKYALEAVRTMLTDPKTADFGTFIFFGKQGVEYHPALADYFAKELGLKPSQVAYLSGDVTDDQKEVIKEQFNDGRIKVLLGGDQTKEGIDLQNNGFATINLALGWNPTQIAQVEGRVWRQGNRRTVAPLIYPLVENSGDAMIYNKFEEKGGRINDLFSYAGKVFDVGEIDPAEKKLALLTDPQDKAKLQVEMNKIALYQERVLLDNDQKELKKIKGDLEYTKNNTEYLTEQLKKSWTTEQDAKEYKKEIKKNNDKVTRIEARIKAKGIADINNSINDLEVKILDIDNKIKEIDKTLPDLLEKFTKEYVESIKLRKTMPQHMDEIKGLIKQVNERSQEEIDMIRSEKIARLEAERAKIEAGELPAYTGSGSNASIGLFNDGTPVELGSLNSIRPMEMPELVRLARKLTGSIPKVKENLGKKLGLFRTNGDILLKADQFAQGNEEQLAKLLAHEIGHVADWIPDKTMARGNLLGRIFSLNKFMSATFSKQTGEALDTTKLRDQATREILAEKKISYTDYIENPDIRDNVKPAIKARVQTKINELGGITNTQIRAELTKVSEYWRPYDPINSSASYVEYRNSAKELYGDAISMLLNSPGTLEKMAPTFYKEFFNALDNKPDLKAEYFELQELLNGSTEEIFAARKEDIRNGFVRAEDLQAGFALQKKNKLTMVGERLRQMFDDVNYPAIKKQRLAIENGAKVEDVNNIEYLLQEELYANNDNFIMVNDLNEMVVRPLEEAGMTVEDMGEYLLLNRIQNDRADIANPYGFNLKNATAQLDYLKSTVGEANFDLLKAKATIFHEIIFKSVEEAVRVGSYNSKAFVEKILPNKNSYATFLVIDHMEDYVQAELVGQIGTLKEVANPFVSTILKTIGLNRLNARQRSKNAAIKGLQENYPAEITKSEKKSVDGKISIFKTAKGKGSIKLLVDGKLESYDVDPYIAESFKQDRTKDLQIVADILAKPNNIFKPLVTTFNMAFSLFNNPIRDFKANYKKVGAITDSLRRTNKDIKKVTALNLLVNYAKSFPSAYLFSKGKLDKLTAELVQIKAINAPLNDYNYDPREDEFGRTLERFHITKKVDPLQNETMNKIRTKLLLPVEKFIGAVRSVMNITETVSKIAGARILKEAGMIDQELAHNVRNYVGTPNFKTRGSATYITNEVLPFSNIMKEGIKADWNMGTNPNTRSGYWWRTVKIDLLPKLLMFVLASTLLKEFYDDVSEYDKTNYLVIPLGWYNTNENSFGFIGRGGADKNGRKAVYMRIPHDEMGRLYSAVMWKLMNFGTTGDTKQLQDVLSIGGGQFPSITPSILIPSAWGSAYIMQKNPYDSFRSRSIIDDTTFQAGGTAKLNKMIQWSMNSFGLTKFATFDTSKNTTLETAVQIAPWFSGVIKISNYGQTETLNKIKTTELQKTAEANAGQKEVIAKYVKIAQDSKSILFATTKYKTAIIKEVLGGHLPTTQEERDIADNVMTKFNRSLKYGLNDDPRVTALIGASTNAKIEILKTVKAEMTPAEYLTFKQGLVKDKIVTPEILFRVK